MDNPQQSETWGRVETVTLADGTMEHYSYDHAGNKRRDTGMIFPEG